MTSTKRHAFTTFMISATITLAISAPLKGAEANGFANTAFVQPDDLVAFQGFGGIVAADGNVMP